MNVFRLRSGSSAATSTKSTTAPSVDYGPITHEPIFTAPAQYEPILNPPLDEEQKQKVKDLMAFMDTIILSKEDPYYPHERGFLSEGTANRYMRARRWDFEAAKTMLENTIKWRREYKPDQLDEKVISLEAETGKMYFSGYDKTGRPLWIMKPRNENSKDSDRQVKHIVFCLERGIRLMPPQVEKIAIVVDFKGSTMSNNASASTCKKFLDILSNHYPERLGVAFLINSPWFFTPTFKVVAPFMDTVTRNKIKFINTDDTKTATNDIVNMEDYIPLNQMEVEYGGTYNFVFDMPTYWSALLRETGEPFKVIEYK